MPRSQEPSAEGHRHLIGRPHDADEEGPIAEAETEAARISSPERPLGAKGKAFDRRSPFLIGMAAAAGVAVTYGLVLMVVGLRDVLILVGLALFIAIGFEPLVSWLVVRRFPRGLAVATVFVVAFGVVAGFLAAAIPVIAEQAAQLVAKAPDYFRQAQDRGSWLGQLNERLHLQQAVESFFSGGAGLLQAGAAVFGALADLVILIVLTVYFVADLPRIRSVGYRLVPRSRRPRAILIGDEIFAKVSGYILGNLVVSAIAGALFLAWMLIFGVPYAVLLAITVALLDLIPVVGSVVGGILVSLAALTVSLPVCLATVGFVVLYRLAEDYLLIPKIIGRTVQVPAMVTVVAVLLGGALLGIVGALVAIPVAAAVLLLAREVLFPRLDSS